MPDPLTYTSATPRFALPLLHAGQAQKEVFVNEALALADTLLHCSVKGQAAAPPGNSLEGDAWVVLTDATGSWAGHEGEIAFRRDDAWIFVAPRTACAFSTYPPAVRCFFSVSGEKLCFSWNHLEGRVLMGRLEPRSMIWFRLLKPWVSSHRRNGCKNRCS